MTTRTENLQSSDVAEFDSRRVKSVNRRSPGRVRKKIFWENFITIFMFGDMPVFSSVVSVCIILLNMTWVTTTWVKVPLKIGGCPGVLQCLQSGHHVYSVAIQN